MMGKTSEKVLDSASGFATSCFEQVETGRESRRGIGRHRTPLK
jgi:hypothetical protein